MPNFEREAKWQAYILFFPAFLSLVGSFVLLTVDNFGFIGLISILLNTVGFFFFYKAKRQMMKRTGIKTSFGPARMTAGERRRYITGYAFIIFALSIMLWAALRLS